MIHRHKKTGDLCRKMGEAFSVEFQKPIVIYTSLKEGQVFSRLKSEFDRSFSYVKNTQDDIVPREPTVMLKE